MSTQLKVILYQMKETLAEMKRQGLSDDMIYRQDIIIKSLEFPKWTEEQRTDAENRVAEIFGNLDKHELIESEIERCSDYELHDVLEGERRAMEQDGIDDGQKPTGETDAHSG